MAKLGQDTDMEQHKIGGSTLGFSAKKMQTLGASEYSLGTVFCDVSGSLGGYERHLENMLGAIVGACRDPRNPRADYMMLRVVLFNQHVTEVHGFRPVMDLNPDDYKGTITCSGSTAALDAVYSGALAAADYAKQLGSKMQIGTNGSLFLITDGEDNVSTATEKMVKDAIEASVKKEALESMIAVLIGMGTGSAADLANVNAYLKNFHDNAGFTQFVDAGQVTPQSLARIAGFVARSHSSQSSALGTGGPSQALTIS